ncbi:Hypothetical predicted protein, partial [Cloeon dipterum]
AEAEKENCRPEVVGCKAHLCSPKHSVAHSSGLQNSPGPSLSLTLQQDNDNSLQPHFQITIKCTKEIAGFNGLSDSIQRLDFVSAVHDTRRFHYVCKVLEELLNHRLASLSGCARRVLFAMLEEVARQVAASQTNMHVLKALLAQLQEVTRLACWGHPLGSTSLWDNHLSSIQRILNIANNIEITKPDEDQEPQLDQMPEECVREIMLRLSDHKDLSSAGEAWHLMQRVLDEQRIWKQLCHYHFKPHLINKLVEEFDQAETDYQAIYHKLRKSYGLKEEFTETLTLCRNCRCLFWQSLGHPCIVERDLPEVVQRCSDNVLVPIPPKVFLTFFSL